MLAYATPLLYITPRYRVPPAIAFPYTQVHASLMRRPAIGKTDSRPCAPVRYGGQYAATHSGGGFVQIAQLNYTSGYKPLESPIAALA